MVETTPVHSAKGLSVAVRRVQMLLKYQAREVFPTGLLLAAGKDIRDTGISWDAHMLALKGINTTIINQLGDNQSAQHLLPRLQSLAKGGGMKGLNQACRSSEQAL